MFKKTQRIIQKNMRLLMRSRASALVIVLGPLFLIVLVGLAFSTYDQYHITVGVYTPGYNNLSDTMLQRLVDAGYSITRYPVADACIDSVKTDESNVCLIFPERFEVSDAANASSEIRLHVDYSEINLVYTVVDVISSHVSAQSQEISAALTGDLLARLSAADAEVTRRVPAIVDVVTTHDAVIVSTDEITKALNSIDLQISSAGVSAETVELDTQRLKEIAANTLLEAHILIGTIQGELAKLQGNTSDARLALAKSSVTFDSYGLELENLNYSVSVMLRNLSSEVSKAQAKLNDALTTRNTAVAKLEEIRTQLTKDIDDLNQVQVGMNNIRKAVASIEVKDAGRIAAPLTTRIMPITSKKTHFNYLFPTLLILVAMITGILLGSTLVLSEKKSRSYFRNQITPTHDVTFLAATFLTAIMVVAVQASIYLLISWFFFHVSLFGSLSITVIIVLLASSVFTFIGILLGTLYKSEETALLAGITVSSIMLLFSSTILPMESMHPLLKGAAGWNPFVLGVGLLKEALFFDVSLPHLMGKLLTLFVYTAVLFLLTLSVQRWLRVHTLLYYHKLSGKSGRVRAELLAFVQQEGSLLRWILPSPSPATDLVGETVMDPLERSLLADAGDADPFAKMREETRQEISIERKTEIEEEIGRLKKELKKME